MDYSCGSRLRAFSLFLSLTSDGDHFPQPVVELRVDQAQPRPSDQPPPDAAVMQGLAPRLSLQFTDRGGCEINLDGFSPGCWQMYPIFWISAVSNA